MLDRLIGAPDDRHRLVTTGEQLEAMVRELYDSDVNGFDCETNGLEWYKPDKQPVGFSLSTDHRATQPSVSWYVPFAHRVNEEQLPQDKVIEALQPLLLDGPEVCGHNIKFDIHHAREIGLHVGVTAHDTQDMARLILENRSKMSLENVVDQEQLHASPFYWKRVVDGLVLDYAKAKGMKKKEYLGIHGYEEIPLGVCSQYAGDDVHFALGLYRKFAPDLIHTPLYQNELRLLRVLVDMEHAGVPVDQERAAELRELLVPEMEERYEAIQAQVPGLNPGNDDSLRDYLFKQLGLEPPQLTDSGLPSVNADSLKELVPHCPILEPIMEWRERKKIVTTYTDYSDLMDPNGRIHTSFLIAGAKSGRFSSREPNLQNIPTRSKLGKEVRRSFPVREPGWVRLYFDYSQIELRVIAWYVLMLTGDDRMAQAYVQGKDIHAMTADIVWGKPEAKRPIAKTMNFGLAYGGGAGMLASNRQFNLSIEEAEAAFHQYHTRFPAVNMTKELFWRTVRQNACQFRGMFGRLYHEPRLNVQPTTKSRRKVRSKAERDSFSKIIQGSAADLGRMSMVRAFDVIEAGNREGRWEAKMVLMVHDEFQIDAAPWGLQELCREVRAVMEDFPQFAPIPITIGGEYTFTNWAEKKEIPGW